MAKEKIKENEDFFGESFVQEVKPEEIIPKPSLNKSRIKVIVFDFLKGNIRAKDSDGQMYIIAPNKDTVNLKVGDSFFI
jgi:hypothetical protein